MHHATVETEYWCIAAAALEVVRRCVLIMPSIIVEVLDRWQSTSQVRPHLCQARCKLYKQVDHPALFVLAIIVLCHMCVMRFHLMH